MPIFPPAQPRDLPVVVVGNEGNYLDGDRAGRDKAAWYAVALQRSIDDAADFLEPLLPAEVRPYVEVFERFLLDRAEHYMAQWAVDAPT